MWSQLTQIAAAAAEKAQSVATDLLDEATADLVSLQPLLLAVAPFCPPPAAAANRTGGTLLCRPRRASKLVLCCRLHR